MIHTLAANGWALSIAIVLATPARGYLTTAGCGDCDSNSTVTVNELVTAVGMGLYGCPVEPECCGDCNQDGRVTINELVTAVKNALDDRLSACGLSCFGPCYSPIEGDPPCPCEGGGCTELPVLVDATRTFECETSICFHTEEQFRSCLLLLHDTTDLCFEIQP